MILPLASQAALARAVVLAVFVAGLVWWHYTAVERGRQEVRAEDAKALAAARAHADAEIARITQLNRDTLHAYEEKLDQAATDNDRLRRDLAGVRVCIDAPSNRRSVPSAANPTGGAPRAPGGDGLQSTVAGDLVAAVAECQSNTEKLISLQRWIAESRQFYSLGASSTGLRD